MKRSFIRALIFKGTWFSFFAVHILLIISVDYFNSNYQDVSEIIKCAKGLKESQRVCCYFIRELNFLIIRITQWLGKIVAITIIFFL